MLRRLTRPAALLLLLLSACVSAPRPVQQAPTSAPELFPIPVIELSGSPQEMGTQYALQLSQPVHELFARYLTPLYQNSLQRFVALTAAKGFYRQLAPEHQQEIDALAQGLALDPSQVMLGQCFLDLMPITACSTIALPSAAAPDGVARFGRNLDFPSRNIADKHSVVLIYRPEGRYAFAAVSWPGLIGVLSGMNEHGLTLANMEVTRLGSTPRAMPYALLYRTLLERCRTVQEAIDLLQRTGRQTANNLMLMDASGDRAVIEITPESVVVRRAPDDQPLISTNHQRGQDLVTPGRCPRYDQLEKASQTNFGRIDAPAVQAMLGGVAQGNMTLQSMVFEPGNRLLYLATGTNAPTQPFYRLDLKQFFAKSHLASTDFLPTGNGGYGRSAKAPLPMAEGRSDDGSASGLSPCR